MRLQRGARLGPYEVTAELGAGGMGEVYRARDTKLNRDVALKALPAAVSGDSERLARLQREAQVLASLNHPNIGAIYGLEDSGETQALVLELVDGPTLADRIGQGAIPLDEALAIARQIADALEAAHAQGIIHRDLKPSNIKITTNGVVKVLDFGLAKAFASRPDPESRDATTRRAVGTEAGTVMGTPAYMSPEQARGLPTDQRTDIWSFCALLFEMLTGDRLFDAPTSSDLLVAVLSSDIAFDRLPPNTPPSVRRLLRRGLVRDRTGRLRSIGDVRLELDDPRAGDVSEETEDSAPTRRFAVPAWTWIAALAVLAAGTALVWQTSSPQSGPTVRKFELLVEGLGTGSTAFARNLQFGGATALSPDGRWITYEAGGQLRLRAIDQLEPRALPGTEGAFAPFWSPDSRWIGFAAGRDLRKVPVDGGTPVTIATTQTTLTADTGGAWTPDDQITFATGNTTLWRVSANGGTPVSLFDLEPDERDVHHASPLPDGRGTLFVAHGLDDSMRIEVFADGGRTTLVAGRSLGRPVYSPSGHVLYQHWSPEPAVWAVGVSLDDLAPTTEPFLVAPGGLDPSVSADGMLLYLQGHELGLSQLTWLDRSGRSVSTLGEPLRELEAFRLSPDGASVAASVGGGVNHAIWVFDVATGQRRLFATDDARGRPRWHPSGTSLLYDCTVEGAPAGICEKPIDGSGEPEIIVPDGSMVSVAPDGASLVFVIRSERTRTDLWRQPWDAPGEAAVIVQTDGFDAAPAIAPNGRLLAYSSTQSGDTETYVVGYPGGDRRVRMSTDSGGLPTWSADGAELFFITGDGALMALAVDPDTARPVGVPETLFTASDAGARLFAGYAVSPDASRVLVVRDVVDREAPARLGVVEHWAVEFQDRR